MKAIALSLVLLSYFPGRSPAATPTPLKPEKVFLQLGSVKVWLGMPESDALSALRRAGFQVAGKDEEGKTILRDGPASYSVAFRDAALIYADREWLLSQRDEISAVLGALETIAPRGSTACTVNHDRVNKPAMQSDRIFVRCGTRSVLIMKGKEPSTEAVLTDVYEFIGRFD